MYSSIQSDSVAVNRARGSSFYLAMRILPREKRQAMFEIYSFCKAVDDIADCDKPPEWRQSRLRQWRKKIDAIYEGIPAPGCERLAAAVERFDLRMADFLAIIEGMEMDTVEDIRAPSLNDLQYYCDRVACAVGRLSVCVFGIGYRQGLALAHHLGTALQLTNILRDIDEDSAAGRLYLPAEALHEAEIGEREPQAVVCHPRIGVACSFIGNLARQHFAKSKAVLDECPRRAARAPKIMLDAYEELFGALTARGWSYPRRPVHLSKPHLLLIVLRHAFI
jgi:presqualene diphosphate synthase